MHPQAWGGAIELSIFANHFQSEIVSIDVETIKPYVFGEGQGYTKRVFVLYSGIHYDALARSPYSDAPLSQDVTVFQPDADEIFAEALMIAELEKQVCLFYSYWFSSNYSALLGIVGWKLYQHDQVQIKMFRLSASLTGTSRSSGEWLHFSIYVK